MRALLPIAALIVSNALPELAQRPLPKVGGWPLFVPVIGRLLHAQEELEGGLHPNW